MKHLSFLLLFPFALHAQTELECKKVEFSEKLVAAVSGVQCPTDDERILSKVAKEYNSHFGALPVTAGTVKGFKLKGPSKEIAFANDILGEQPPKGWAEAAKGCDTVRCALGKLLKSDEAAMQLMNIKMKTGSTVSLDQKPNKGTPEQLWSPAEIREMDAAITKLPPELRKLSSPRIKRVPDGYRLGDDSANVAAFARPGVKGFFEAEVVVYDAGMHGLTNGASPYATTSWPQEALIHELCHHHDFKGIGSLGASKMVSEKKNSEFAALSGWKEVTNAKGQSEWKASDKANFVSGYAGTAPAEDYAESCMNYLLHPAKLKKESPEKFAYMKKNVFNQKEFFNEEWVSGSSNSWPELASILKDESSCTTKIAECTKDIRTIYSWISTLSQLKDVDCMKKYRKARAQEINSTLATDPNYCENGGESNINRESDKICEASLSNIASVIDTAKKTDLTAAIKTCEDQNDFTSDCIFEKAQLAGNVPQELKETVARLISDKIPDRAAAVGKNIQKTNSNVWLKACLSNTSNVQVYDGTSNGKSMKIVSYNNKNKEVQSGYLGKYIYEDYNGNDVNKACATDAIAALKKEGHKIPDLKYPVNVMQKPFLEELDSFQTDVIQQMGSAMKGCMIKKCKDDRVFDLIQAWEQKKPQQREGFATKEFATELREKVTTY